jgi:hypothetical protein
MDVPFVGGPCTPPRALRSHSALPSAGGATKGCGGIPCTGVGCDAGGATPGLLNWASRAARLAVGVPVGAGGFGVDIGIGGGNWNAGG